jgi:hypothetical protein
MTKLPKPPKPASSLLLGTALTLAAACTAADDQPPDPTNGTLAGRVVLTSPVANATVTVSQIDLTSPTGEIRAVAGTATTDATGAFSVELGELNGLFLVESAGGEYTEPASGERIALDPSATIRSLQQVELFAGRADALVGPIGHLTEAMARGYLAHGDAQRLDDALAAVKPHLDAHFGDVDWERTALADLSQPATSPTEPVRASLVLGAWALLATDLAVAAEASPQEINSYTLLSRWAEDLAAGPFAGEGAFDGNDGNARATGLQVGACAPTAPECAIPAGCSLGACRTLCDLYSGTPRAIFAGELMKLVRAPDNGTGLGEAALMPIALALSERTDALLFGSACTESLDNLPPTLLFDEGPAEGAYVRGSFAVRAIAIDDTDPSPVAGFAAPFADTDGDPANSIARTTIDTTDLADGALVIVATANDRSENAATAMRGFSIDNTAPSLSVSSDGFHVETQGGQSIWWTPTSTPVLAGTVADAAPVQVRAYIAGNPIATATVNGSSWSLSIPDGGLAFGGSDVTIQARDAAGNTRDIVQHLRADTTPPIFVVEESTVRDETGDAISFPSGGVDFTTRHVHNGAAIDLSVDGGCPVVTKHVTLTDAVTPYITEDNGAVAGRNPIRYAVAASDDGIGVEAAEYRVIHANGTVVRAWTAMPAGTQVGNTIDYTVLLDGIAALRATEGEYTIEWRIRDRFDRTTTDSRCWTHRLLAPAVKTTAPVSAASGIMSALGLSATGLSGTASSNVATKLLNDDSLGASLVEMTAWNGSELPSYLTVNLTAATTFTVQQSFVLRNAKYNVTTVSQTCTGTVCDEPSTAQASYTSPLSSPTAIVPTMTIRVWSVNADGSRGPELQPCTPAAGCATSGTTFEYLLPGRDGGGNQPAKRYLVATMSGRIPALRPVDAGHGASAPFADTTVSSPAFQIAGLAGLSSTGCTQITEVIVGGQEIERCTQRASVRPYRASTQMRVTTNGATTATYSTAATSALAPRALGPSGSLGSGYVWSTFEDPLPPSY